MICAVDEAWCWVSSLAELVFAAAIILDSRHRINGLHNSKNLANTVA